MNTIQWHGSAVRGFAVRGNGTTFFARRSRPFARTLALLSVVALVASTQIVPRPPAEAAVAVDDADAHEIDETDGSSLPVATPNDDASERGGVELTTSTEFDVAVANPAVAVAPVAHPGPEAHSPDGNEVRGISVEPAAAPTAREPGQLQFSMDTSAELVASDTVFGATMTITNAGTTDVEDVYLSYDFGDGLLVVRSVHCDNDPFGTEGCELGTIAAGETVQAAVLLWSRVGAYGAQPLRVSVTTGGTPATVRTPAADDEVLGTTDPSDDGAVELVILTPDVTVGVTEIPSERPVAPIPAAELSVVALADRDVLPANGTITYTVLVTNAGPGSATGTVLTVAAGDNLQPANCTSASSGIANCAIGASGLTLIASDGCQEDPNGIPVCSVGALPAHSTKIVTFTFAVGPNTQGGAQFNVQVDSDSTDPITLNDDSTLTLDFNGLPVANDDTASLAEDASATVLDIIGNDADPDGDPLVITKIDTTGTAGTVALAAGVVTYDPAGAFDTLGVGDTATDTFTYTIDDVLAGSATATVTVTITGVNEAPVATDDTLATAANATVTATKAALIGDDADANGDPLAFGAISTTGTTGAVTTTATNVTYDPDDKFDSLAVGATDTDTFTYTVTDGNGGSDTGTVTVTINGVNDAPDAKDDSASIGEDAGATTVTVLTNDTDVDTGDTRTVTSVGTVATIGTVALNAGVITYDPNGQFELLALNDTSSDSFTYTITDSNAATDTATVTITITGANDAPAAVNDTAMAEAGGAFVDIDVVANDTDVDAFDVPTLDTVTAPAIDGTVSIVAGKVRYTPPATPTTDTFTYTIKDGQGATATGSVTVTVAFGPLPPSAVADAVSMTEDAAATPVAVTTNDTDPNNDTLVVTALDTTGTTGNATLLAGAVSYAPNGAFDALDAGDTTTDTFTYTISDGDAGTANDTATVTVTITGVNDAPVAGDDTAAFDEDDAAAAIAVLTNDSDIDADDTPTVTAIDTAGTVGSATLTSGVVSYSPNGAFAGLAGGATTTDTFTYTISDGNGGSDTATVTVTMTGVNNAPDAVDDTATFAESAGSATVDVALNDTDPDTGDTKTVTAIDTTGTVGSASLVAGVVSYDPNGAFESVAANATATDTFTYTISDGALTDTATVTITINGENDPVTAADDSATIDENIAAATALDVRANDTDPDTADTLTVTGFSGHDGTVAIVGGDLTYLPTHPAAQALAEGASLQDIFTYTLSDGNGSTNTATVTVTINGQNDAPVTVADSLTINAGATDSVNVIGNDSDPDTGDTVTITSVAAPATGAATTSGTTGVQYTASGWDSLDDGEVGSEAVTYTAEDSLGAASSGTLNVTVNGKNDAPVAAADTATAVTNGAQITIDVLGNDSDVDVETIEVTGTASPAAPAQPTQGNVAFTATGVTYTPHPTFIGTDVFTYTISDGDLTATGTVTVNVAPEADLAVTVVDDTDPVVAGQNVTYTVTVTNNGPSVATNTIGAFTTPAGTTLVGVPVVALGTIGSGASATFDVTLATDASPNPSTVTFVPTASADPTDPVSGNNTGSEDTTVTATPNADLKVTASVDKALVTPSDSFTWTVTVENLGPQAATNVVAVSTLPAGVTLVSTTGCDQVLAIPNCGLGTIGSGTSKAFEITVTVDAGTTGLLELAASATSDLIDFVVANNATTSSTVAPLPPVAVDDAPPAASAPGAVLHTPVSTTLTTTDGSAQDLDANDTIGDPASAITTFGGGALGGTVTDNAAGTTATITGVGALTVNANGTLTFVPVSTITGVTSFDYRRANVGGTSDASVTIAIGTRPSATADSYSSIGNVGVSVPAGSGVLSNDAGDSLTITAFDTTSVKGGSIAMAADGSFTYSAPAGATGADTFTYTITNGFGSSTATVTINLSGMIWFVDGTAAAGGDGTLDGPFNAVPASVGSNGDTIFVAANAPGAIALKPLQKLIGAGATVSLATAGGITIPAFSLTLPSTGGARPTITAASATAVGLSSDNTVRGLDVAATGVGGVAIAETTLGNDPGTVTILEASASATTKSAIQISGGTQNIALDGVSAGGASDGVQLTGSTGGTIDLSGISITLASSAAIKIDGLAMVTITGATNTVTVTNPLTTSVEIAAPIGAGGVSFQKIDSSGGPTAIKLSGTGTGAFTVTGTGITDASGGTVQNTTADAVILTNVGGPVTLKNMTFINIGNLSTAVSGHDVVHVQNMTGKLAIDNADVSVVSDNFVHGVAGQPFSGGLEVTNSTIERTNRFDANSTSGDGTNDSEGAIWADGISGLVTIRNNTFTNGNQFVYLKPSTAQAMTAAIDGNSFTTPDNGSAATTGQYCVNIVGAGGMHTVNIGAASPNTFTNCFLGSVRMYVSGGSIGGSLNGNALSVSDHDDGQYGNSTNWNQGGVLLETAGSGAIGTFAVTNNSFGASGDRWLSNLANLEITPNGLGSTSVNVIGNTFTAPFESGWQVRGAGVATVTIQNNTYVSETLIGQLVNEFFVNWEGPGRPYCVAAEAGANLNVTIQNENLAGHELDQAQAAYSGASLQLVAAAGGSLIANVSGVQITPTTAGNNDDISVYAGVGGTQTGTGATAIVSEPSGASSSCGVTPQ